MATSPAPHATIRTKLSLAFATAFALVVVVGVFGVTQLHSVNSVTQEIREIWLPKIENLNRIRAAVAEHRLLAVRRIQTTNFRHVAAIAKSMEAMRATVSYEAQAYERTAEADAEYPALSQFRMLWSKYQDAYGTVLQRLEIGEVTPAFDHFETAALPAFDQAISKLDYLLAQARQGGTSAEARAQETYNFALGLTIGVSLLAALAAWAATVWTSRNITAPIMRVSEAMERLAKGDHAVEIATDYGRKDEIGILVDSVNGYRASLVRGRQLAEQAAMERERLHAAASNMPIGLAMFDADRRLIICNKRYSEIYRLPPELAVPGTTLDSILAQRVAAGVSAGANSSRYVNDVLARTGNSEPGLHLAELSDGRTLSILHQPLPGGGWVSTHEDVTEWRKAEARIRHMARHDALTDLPNRVLFKERIEEALKLVRRGESIAVLCMDLDRFKAVNDTLGHPIGDALLQRVSDRIREIVRDVDTVARFGGDEFAIIQVGTEQPQGTTALAHRLIEALGAGYEIDGHEIVIGCSLGISVAPEDGEDADQLIKKADMALYRAKLDGRATYRFFEPHMDARMQARRALELDLRKALAEGEFELVYQPIIDLSTSRICCFEALLRWRHPERGLVMPDDFIPLAEEIGVIVPIGAWVLLQACRDSMAWPEDIKVSVNLSYVQFRNDKLVAAVATALSLSKLVPSRLELEITEGVLVTEQGATLALLHELRELGVKIVMDDFGTGYSSLSYIRSFPFDKIKIDKSFIHNIEQSSSFAIVRAVTGLGESLGMTTTAEGVETEEQLERVRREGCTEVQGFLFSAGKPASELEPLIALLHKKPAVAA
jgi:diguanylate cyclase (GGDEF)-like protein